MARNLEHFAGRVVHFTNLEFSVLLKEDNVKKLD